MITLPNNRLILNWHKINSLGDLFAYTSKRLKANIYDFDSLWKTLSEYKDLQIAIWHWDTFLSEESKITQQKTISLLSEYWTMKITRSN